jgi:predicted nucleic acid-binding protein
VSTLYFESSAFIKLLIDEPGSTTALAAWAGGSQVSASPLIFVEARAGLAAAQRGRRMTPDDLVAAKRALGALRPHVNEVRPKSDLLAHAEELTEQEALRGYDAVHLATALFGEVDVLITADAALIDAAHRRGLDVIDART